MTSQAKIRCGALLREARHRHGLGQVELARRVGTAQPAISRIERDVGSPTLATLNRILEALGETLILETASLAEPPPGGGNQSIAELRRDYHELSAEQRLEQAAELSQMATELAAQADG
jgi:transcriptional regulator with XRE-family HTH domain